MRSFSLSLVEKTGEWLPTIENCQQSLLNLEELNIQTLVDYNTISQVESEAMFSGCKMENELAALAQESLDNGINPYENQA